MPSPRISTSRPGASGASKQSPSWCESSTPRMSNGVASAGTSSGSSTKRNSASGSMNRPISQAQAVRSTCGCALVATSCRDRLEAVGEPLDRGPRLVAPHGREVVASADAAQLAPQASQRALPAARLFVERGCRGTDDGFVFLGDPPLHTVRELALLDGRARLRHPDLGAAAGLQHLLGEPLELLAGAAVSR